MQFGPYIFLHSADSVTIQSLFSIMPWVFNRTGRPDIYNSS